MGGEDGGLDGFEDGDGIFEHRNGVQEGSDSARDEMR